MVVASVGNSAPKLILLLMLRRDDLIPREKRSVEYLCGFLKEKGDYLMKKDNYVNTS